MIQIIQQIFALVLFFCIAPSALLAGEQPLSLVAPKIAGDATDHEIFPTPKKARLADTAVGVAGLRFVFPDELKVDGTRWGNEMFSDLIVAEGGVVVAVRQATADEMRGWAPDPSQGYRLLVAAAPEGGDGVVLAYGGRAGALYGLQTLRQMLYRHEGKLYLRTGEVDDWPSIRWRGVKATGLPLLQFYMPGRINFNMTYISMQSVKPQNYLAEMKAIQDKLLVLDKEIARIAPPKNAPADSDEEEDDNRDVLPLTGELDLEASAQQKLSKRRALLIAEQQRLEKANQEKADSDIQLWNKSLTDREAYCVSLCVSLNPGAVLDLSPAWMEDLRKTVGVWRDRGAEHVLLAFDDTGASLSPATAARFKSYPEAQAWLMRSMMPMVQDGKKPDGRLYLMHQCYFGVPKYMKKNTAIQKLVAAGLPEGLFMSWTGNGVLSNGTTALDVSNYSKIFGKPAKFFYHNWPIMAKKTLGASGPMPKQGEGFSGAIDAFMLCGAHDASSTVGIFTGLEYAWNAEAYDPEKAIRRAIRVWVQNCKVVEAYKPMCEIMIHNFHEGKRELNKTTSEELANYIAGEKAYYAPRIEQLRSLLKAKCYVPESNSANLPTEWALAYGEHMEKLESMAKIGNVERVFTAWPRGDAAIELDGVPDEAVWKNKPIAENFVRSDNKPALTQTRFSIVYDADHLYVAVWCDEANPSAIQARASAGWGIQHLDHILLSLNHTGSGKGRALLATTIVGQSAYFEFGQQWQKGYVVKTAKNATGWTAEFKIPLAAIDEDFRPVPGRRWATNLFRLRMSKGSTGEASSWFPTLNEFDANYMGELNFE